MARNSSQGRQRRPPSRQRITSILVVCEGQTEEAYFAHLGQQLRGTVKVKALRDTSSPETIVKAAIKCKHGDPRRGMSPDAFDEVWAVFDWDGRTDQVRSAQALASDAGVFVALSNPSFEVWLLWHFCDFSVPGCQPSEVKDQSCEELATVQQGYGYQF